jgi:hypothetical protein
MGTWGEGGPRGWGVHEDMEKGNPHGWGVDWDMGIGWFPTDRDSWGLMRTWGIDGDSLEHGEFGG